MSPSFAVYLLLQLCMLGTAVIEGMHENKFQGDTLMEFSMTMFGGIAMTFFTMSCMLVLDFWFGFLCFLVFLFEVGVYSLFRASNQV